MDSTCSTKLIVPLESRWEIITSARAKVVTRRADLSTPRLTELIYIHGLWPSYQLVHDLSLRGSISKFVGLLLSWLLLLLHLLTQRGGYACTTIASR